MKTGRTAQRWILASFMGTLGLVLTGGTLTGGAAQSDGKEPVPGAPAEKPLAVAEARERARLMHNIYAATLEVMHQHFFKRERSVLPARAMEDVFAEMDRQTKIKAAWISVNTKPMSIHHEPRSDFEKQAAKAIAAGKSEFERVENGVYQRAGAIPLGAGCVSCHTGFFAKAPQTQRFAALVITMPLSEK